jgi:hypothetical protein
MVGPGPAQFFFIKKTSKIFFGILQFSRIFYVILINIKQYFYVAKNTTFGIKIPGFRKKKNMFLFSCIQPNLSKLKNSYSIFIQQRKLQKKCFIMHFGFNNQFIKVKRIWPIFQKNPKKLFCFFLYQGLRIYTYSVFPILKQ